MGKEVFVIGAGPAGVSAALTLRMRDIDATILHSGKTALHKAHRVDNYPGMPRMSGEEMERIFQQQCEEAGVKYRTGLARMIQKTRKGFMILVGEDIVNADAVLLCTGIGRVARIEGEEGLVGQGVSYCATCDGMLYRGRSVAVVAQDASFHEDTEFLMNICKVDYYQERRHDAPKGVHVCEGKPLRLSADDEGKIHLFTQSSEKTYDCVFILRPAVALDQLLPGLKLSGSAIVVDERMRTSVEGVFAAGDVTGKEPADYQIARAVGQGNTAALSIATYLSEKDKA